MGNKLSSLFKRIQKPSTTKKDWSDEQYKNGDQIWSTHKTYIIPDVIDFTAKMEILGSNKLSSAAKAVLTAYGFIHQTAFDEYILVDNPSASIRDNLKTLQDYGVSIETIEPLSKEQHYAYAHEYRIYTPYIVLNIDQMKYLLMKCIPLVCGYNGVAIVLTGFDESLELFLSLIHI